MLTKPRWREYGKRFLPRNWYRVRRRKFPLKSKKKEWALQITKHYNFFYQKNIRKCTTYDSSFAYYRYLSIGGRLKRKRKKFLRYVLGRRVEHLIYFPWKFQPKFTRLFAFNGRKSHLTNPKKHSYSHKVLNNSYLKQSRQRIKNFYTPTSESKFSLATKSSPVFGRVRRYYSKYWSVYSDTRHTLFNIHLSGWYNKLSTSYNQNIAFSRIIESRKYTYSDDLASSIVESRQNKYSYLSKIIVFNSSDIKQLLSKALSSAYIRPISSLMSFIFKLPNKNSIIRGNFFNLNLLKKLRGIMYISRYMSIRSEFCTVDLGSRSLVDFYKIVNAYSKVSSYSNSHGKFSSKMKRSSFVKRRKKSHEFQLISKLPTYFKKNKWIFNSFEVSSGTLVSLNGNV